MNIAEQHRSERIGSIVADLGATAEQMAHIMTTALTDRHGEPREPLQWQIEDAREIAQRRRRLFAELEGLTGLNSRTGGPHP